MKESIVLTATQRRYLYELVSIDMEINGSFPIHDEEVARDVDIADGTGNSFRGYLMGLLGSDFKPEDYKKIDKRYWTYGRIGQIEKTIQDSC